MRKSAEALAPAFDLVPLDFSAAPPIERKALETKKKEKPPKTTENNASPAASANKAEGSEAKPVKKKEKQDAIVGKNEKKKAADKPKATSTATEDAGSLMPSMIDLRVGHIVEGTSAYQFSRAFAHCRPVKKHPDADGLYVEVCDEHGICASTNIKVSLANRLWRRNWASHSCLWPGELYSH